MRAQPPNRSEFVCALPPITSVVIGVPARNEERRIGRCLESILAATLELDPIIDVAVCVACDSCNDSTESVVEYYSDRFPLVRATSGLWRSAGAARRASIATMLEATGPARPASQVWIATTDADSVVSADWLTRHLDYADDGFGAVAGVVELVDDEDRTEVLAAAFEHVYAFDTPTTHPHVHGANLGVRASDYLNAGGFPTIECSEDHALWNRLGRDGVRRISPTDLRVSTSARLHGRAPGGFADTLAAALD